MKRATRKTRTTLFSIGLLVLAGAFSDVRFASAQAQDTCPFPEISVADPSVTAQQVENGSASLEDFALAATESFREHGQHIESLEQGARFGCLLRQEGGPYRSGSTYTVQVVHGRVLFHAKDMSLRDRQLNTPDLS